MIWLGVDPRLDNMRSDPRYTSLMRRLAIPSGNGNRPPVATSRNAGRMLTVEA